MEDSMSHAAREKARLWWIAEQKRRAKAKRASKPVAPVRYADEPTDYMPQGDGYYHDQHGEPNDD
jgi:hypothetical protein